jgi:hypothetical protein
MRRVCLTIGIIFFGLCLSTQVWSFGLAPAIIELEGERGQILESRFTLVNEDLEEKTFYFEILKFEAKDESGSPEFIPFEEDHEDLPEWITFENKSLIVPARSFIEVLFNITIPTDTPSGGYYAAITVSNSKPIDETVAPTIRNKTAILIFLDIEGETLEKAALLDFVAPKIVSKTAGTFSYRIQNQGNVYLKPKGTIVLKDVFGRTLIEVDANPDENRVLSETTRKIKTNFSGKTAFGPVTAKLQLEYGEQNQKLSDSITFWVLPWKILLTGFGTIMVLCVGLTTLVKRKR